MRSQSGNVVIRNVPYGLWIFGIIFAGIGISIGLFAGAPIIFPIIFGGVGLAMILFVPILTVTVDRNSGLLTLQRTGILRRSAQEIRIDQIEDIFLKENISHDEDGTSVTYQTIIALEDGTKIPLRRYTSSGHRKKEQRVRLLKDAIGLEERPRRNQMGFEATPMATPPENAHTPEGEQVTDGVRWELQHHRFTSAPVSRWFSPEVETPDYFVFIAQKQEGQGEQKGIMNLFGKSLFKQSLKMYGFDESYTPGLDQAVIHQEADKRLMQDFFIFTSNTREAHRVLNPWVVTPLLAWTDRYPLNSTGHQFSQMTVLFSPWGLFISVFGILNARDLEEITTLGVEIVKSTTT